MKRIILSLMLIVALATTVVAQTYRIDSSEVSFEDKLRPCFYVKYDADAITVKKGWVDYMKKNYGIKPKGIGFLTNKDLLTAEDVTLSSVSDKRMNMYARVTDVAGGSDLKFFMSFGYDFFIGPDKYENEFASMKKLLNDFSVDFLTAYYSDEASRLISKIKDQEKDIKKNNRIIKKNNRKARKASSEVAKGLSAKNTAHEMENQELQRKIGEMNAEIERVKIKQGGINRN